MLSACGSDPNSFQPGDWELQAWLEGDTPGVRAGEMTDSVTITQDLASASPKAVFFSEFYHGAKAANVTFEDGEISGHLDQGAVAPFPAHSQSVSGWYRSDSFEMKIAMPVIGGVQSYQVVTGKLVDPAI
ncbi:hypothetical protein K3163_07225 [Qipengyuania sp. 1NDW9]|nr:hypothetical protein [Qipengyuania xiapuensis]MBX7492996.1 hypothetical protein [Qipengyuania xiapuensis]